MSRTRDIIACILITTAALLPGGCRRALPSHSVIVVTTVGDLPSGCFPFYITYTFASGEATRRVTAAHDSLRTEGIQFEEVKIGMLTLPAEGKGSTSLGADNVAVSVTDEADGTIRVAIEPRGVER